MQGPLSVQTAERMKLDLGLDQDQQCNISYETTWKAEWTAKKLG